MSVGGLSRTMTTHYRLSASSALELLLSSRLTVTDYAQCLLNRINDRESTVHAWAYLDHDEIMKQAAALDAIEPARRGPLHGLAIGVKDVILTKDQPTRYNSKIYKDAPKSNVDAACIKILRAAGALIIGKTQATELGASNDPAPTTNPHDPTRTPGASSSGSAAAVCDFHVPLALGQQTGGSTNRPASYTGIFGFKPTFGAIQYEGVKTLSSSLDTVGLFARSVQDLELLAQVFRMQEKSSDHDIRGAKFAIYKGPNWADARKGTKSVMDQARKSLERAGASVEDLELPSAFDQLPRHVSTICKAETRSSLLPEYRMDKSLLSPALRKMVEAEVSYTDQRKAEDASAAMRPQFDTIASAYAAIITPSATGEAEGMDNPGSGVFNSMWSLLHVPVLNVPGFLGPTGMPVGVSLVCGRDQDAQLLSVGRAVAKLFAAEDWTVIDARV